MGCYLPRRNPRRQDYVHKHNPARSHPHPWWYPLGDILPGFDMTNMFPGPTSRLETRCGQRQIIFAISSRRSVRARDWAIAQHTEARPFLGSRLYATLPLESFRHALGGSGGPRAPVSPSHYTAAVSASGTLRELSSSRRTETRSESPAFICSRRGWMGSYIRGTKDEGGSTSGRVKEDVTEELYDSCAHSCCERGKTNRKKMKIILETNKYKKTAPLY